MKAPPPPQWVAEGQRVYMTLGQLHATQRKLKQQMASLARQIDEAHATIEHLYETTALATAAVDEATRAEAAAAPDVIPLKSGKEDKAT